MDYSKLVEMIHSEKNLWSTTENCAIACATGDLSRAPAPYRESIDKAWVQLDASQQITVNEYRENRGLKALPFTALSPSEEARRLFQVVTERVSDLYHLDKLPETERRRYLEAIVSTIHVHYLAEDETVEADTEATDMDQG